MKQLKESNEYGYIWRMHHSLQISTSHYVPAEDGAIRLMDGYLPQLYHLRDQMRDKFGLLLLSNFEDYPQEKSCELDSYYEKIYIALKAIDLEDSKEHTNDRYYITRKKYRTVNGKGFFEYTLSYAQEEITKFDRFVAYSFNDIPDNYSIQCDFYQSNIDFNGVGIDIKCLIAWNVAIRPCELEKLARICGYDIVVKSDNLYYKALMKFLSRTGMNLLDILLADNEEYEIYIQQIELSKKTELNDTFDKIREVIIKEKPGSNILRYITAYLKNDVIRDQLADRTNNLLSYLYLKNEAIPFDEMPYASSLCGHNLSKLRLHKCLEIYDCECQYVSSMVNKEAYDSNILYVIVDHDKLDYYQYEVGIFNNNLYNSKKQQLRKIDTFANHLYVKNYYETTKSVIEKLQKYTLERIDVYSDMIDKQADFMQEIDDDNKRKIVANIYMNSKLGMIYGAAGTGKTRVAEYIAKIFEDKNILLLANTNAAKNNLERRIKSSCDCYTVYDYLKNGYSWKKYDLVILDECSTVCNEDVLNLFEKCNAEAYLLIGDIYQIEAIKFGNWFNFARYFVDKKSVYELVTPYRAKYCGAICIDEVQDIDKHMQEIIEELSGMEIPMILMGDPKQDLKGFKCLRNLMSIYEQNVRYISECHRCPQLHLELSNRLVDKNEKQKSEKDSGQLSVYYESEIDCHTLIERQKYDLMYISQKQGVYETHDYKKNNIRENLAEELEPLLFENHPTKDAQTVKKVAYYYAGKMIEKYRSTREKKDAMTLLSNWEKIDSRRYGIIINLFEDESPIKQEDKIFVKSIDYIKGMEGEKCLFILTNDLAAHLFNNNTETNKTKNKLYVALTRSLNELSIYILKEVEDKYTKKRIQDFFERYL